MKQLCLLLCCTVGLAHAQSLTEYVNPFIGTGGHGHTYPGATVPFGAVQLSPDTRPDGYNDWDGCSGYHYSDSLIYGFSHTHLSGTGVADYCDILLMPVTVDGSLQNEYKSDRKYASGFHHKNETATPGYYSVLLEEDSIYAELTTTARTGMHAYHFPSRAKRGILLDLTHRDRLLEGSYIEIVSPTKIQGLRRSSSWARDQWVYFAIEFSEPFVRAGIVDSSGSEVHINTAIRFDPGIVSGTALRSYFQFAQLNNKPVYIKCALSAVSCDGAWKNMEAENPGWDFQQVRKSANDLWEQALQKIIVQSPDNSKRSLQDPDNALVIFYTALYHCMLAPNIFEDVDGRYRGMDGKIHIANDHTQYTVFSLWDTYRTLHPLLTLLEPDRTGDFINTMLSNYRESGRLPVWELAGNETNCMIGYHAVSVITDAALKGIQNFDKHLAMEAMLATANSTIFGIPAYVKNGFLESNEEPESVSKTLEYAYDDWCIAQYLSHIMQFEPVKPFSDHAHEEDVLIWQYYTRGFNYVHLIDSTGFSRPRFNGGWYAPFDPFEVNFNFTEANAWQYSLAYPQYLTQCHLPGSGKNLRELLDALFEANAKTTGREQADITGLIGQYAHGNEPSHHVAYLYNYTDSPHKTQSTVHRICNEFYKNTPDGLIGNEDCGQMSAWYVMSALGIYPACPGSPEYTLSTPLFSDITLQLSKPLQITTDKDPSTAGYIAGIAHNKNPLHTLTIAHSDLLKGGALHFNVSATPTEFGAAMNTQDCTAMEKYMPLQAPVISAAERVFQNSTIITISGQAGTAIEYSLDNKQFKPYSGSFHIDSTSSIFARSVDKAGNKISPVSHAVYTHIPELLRVKYKSPYSQQYTAGGDLALVDGLRGGEDFRTGAWQGFQGEDMVIVVDLGEKRVIQQAGAGFLQDVRSWIWMPELVQISVSSNGKKFKSIATATHDIVSTDYDSKAIKSIQASFKPIEARYVQIRAVNFGPVPDWHPGNGGATWIFCDEVWVK